MALELKDPATGKIKPVYLIAGAGIGIVGLFLLMGSKGGTGGVVSGGQSGENTDALAGLQDAIIGLAGRSNDSGGGGGGSGSAPSLDPPPGFGTSSPADTTIPVGTTYAPDNTTPSYTSPDPYLGDGNVAPSVGDPSGFAAKISVPSGETFTPINSYPAAANTPQAVSKPSNSGLSSAPQVYNPSPYSAPTPSLPTPFYTPSPATFVDTSSPVWGSPNYRTPAKPQVASITQGVGAGAVKVVTTPVIKTVSRIPGFKGYTPPPAKPVVKAIPKPVIKTVSRIPGFKGYTPPKPAVFSGVGAGAVKAPTPVVKTIIGRGK